MVCQVFLLWLQRHALIGIGVQLLRSDLATLSYCRFHLAPDAANVLLGLFAVGLRHRSAEIWFYRRLKGTHLQDLHLHTYLLKEAGVVFFLCNHTIPSQRANGIEENLICYRNNVIVGLGISI